MAPGSVDGLDGRPLNAESSYDRTGTDWPLANGRNTSDRQSAVFGRVEDSPLSVAVSRPRRRLCEQLLLDSGQADHAYARYGLSANRAGTYLAWFRAVAKKYPQRPRDAILADLVQHTPGDEGKWFAAAKDAKLFDEAIALANATPCDPKTLTRAARDFAQASPVFAVEAGLAALRWLVGGYGYEITSLDVRAAYAHTLTAASNACVREATEQRFRSLFNHPTARTGLVADVIGRELGLR